MRLGDLLEAYDVMDCIVWVSDMTDLEQNGRDTIYKGTVEVFLEKFPSLEDREVRHFHYTEANRFIPAGLEITI